MGNMTIPLQFVSIYLFSKTTATKIKRKEKVHVNHRRITKLQTLNASSGAAIANQALAIGNKLQLVSWPMGVSRDAVLKILL